MYKKMENIKNISKNEIKKLTKNKLKKIKNYHK